MIIPTLLSVLIPIIFLYFISALDVHTQRRRRLLVTSFIWGVVSFSIAYLTFTALVNNRVFSLQQVVTVGAPITEELLKAGCLYILARRLQIRSAVDGAEYGFAVGIGFSVVENLLYLSSAAPGTGLETTLARVLSTNLMHGLTTGIVGATLGSNYYRSRRVVQVRTTLAILLAIGIHVVFNQIVLHADSASLVAIAIMFGLSGLAILLFVITLAMNAERDWIEKQLKQDNVSAGERMAVANPGVFADLLAKQKIGLDENQMKMLNEYVQLQGERAILQRKIALNERMENYEPLLKQEIELNQEISELSRKMGIYLRLIVRLVMPSAEDTAWIAVGRELGLDNDAFMKALVIMGERQKTVSPENLKLRRQILNESPLFNVLDSVDLDDLSLFLDELAVKAGDVVEDTKGFDSRLFIVGMGRFEATLKDLAGVDTVINVYGPGDTFGELSLIDLKPYPLTVTASENSLAYTLDRDSFIALISGHPNVNLRLLKELATHIREQTELITLVRYLGAKNLPVQVERGTLRIPTPAPFLSSNSNPQS